jgi:hypothetical protein
VLLASHSNNPEQMVNRSTVHLVVVTAARKLQLQVTVVVAAAVVVKSEAVQQLAASVSF